MKYIKTFVSLSLILIMAAMIPLVGCGNGGEEATPTPMPTATAITQTGETGTLSDIAGDVQVLRYGSNSWIEATSGMKIGTGDSLQTGDDGYVLITFFDGSVMEVEADTEISVEELSVASGGSTTVRIHQTIGSTLNRVENIIDSSSKYEVETPAGTAAVRGTTFRNNVERDGGIIHTCVSTFNEEGQHFVDFSNNGETVEIPEGKTACCWEGGVPGNPFWTDPDDNPANFTGGGGGSCYGYGCYVYTTPTPTPMQECSPGCYEYMIGDGNCDEACYTEACSYDYGDCAE
ncbi:MAG: FecR domain-containing protein [Dehalococcoidia bacterium]